MTRHGPADEAGPSAAAAAKQDRPEGTRREKFAMVPESLITGKIAGAGRHQQSLVYLYAYLDLHQGDRGRPARNLTRIAEALGCQVPTASRWAHELQRAGVVEIVRIGRAAAEVRVVHNPARDRWNAEADVEVGTRSEPVRAGTRATHRSRRGARPFPTDARSSRVDDPDPPREERASAGTPESREERAQGRAKNARRDGRQSREERAPAQVSEGLGVRSVTVDALAGAFDAEVVEEYQPCRTCGVPAEFDGYCAEHQGEPM